MPDGEVRDLEGDLRRRITEDEERARVSRARRQLLVEESEAHGVSPFAKKSRK